jgi:cysteine desulfurase
MVELPIYLDYNATTPCDPRVVEAMIPYFSKSFGNAASRSHSFGWQASEAVELAREQLSQLIGAEPAEIVFTSGATEAVNLAIKGVAELYRSRGSHIITVSTEHKAVLDSCKHLEKLGFELSYLGVNSEGIIDLNQLESAIRPDTILISVMFANNETGVLQPIREISALAKAKGILFFSDATQAVGKIPVNVISEGIDLMAFSAHKLYGPKGVGALYVRRKNPRVRLQAQMDGGGHEKGMRSGTLNVPGIVGFGKACEICISQMEVEALRLSGLRNQLEEALLAQEAVLVNGSRTQRMPHVTNLSFRNADAEALMMGLNKEIALSSGSACTSASLEPSHVLKAMGLDRELAHSSLRFALGRFTTEEEIRYVIDKVGKTVSELRNLNPGWEETKSVMKTI